MREILFRGKRVDNGEWIEGDLRHWRNGTVGIHSDDLKRTLPVLPETVGQYTGMNAKNGRIFEGDIIKAKIEGGNHEGFTWPNMRVEFEQGAFCLVHGEHNRLCNFNGLAPSVSLEVIGNIHDNTELIDAVNRNVDQ